MMPAGPRSFFFSLGRSHHIDQTFFGIGMFPVFRDFFYFGIYYLFSHMSHMLEVPDPLFSPTMVMVI